MIVYLTLAAAVVFAAGTAWRVRTLRRADGEYFATLPDHAWTDEALATIRNPDAADGSTARLRPVAQPALRPGPLVERHSGALPRSSRLRPRVVSARIRRLLLRILPDPCLIPPARQEDWHAVACAVGELAEAVASGLIVLLAALVAAAPVAAAMIAAVVGLLRAGERYGWPGPVTGSVATVVVLAVLAVVLVALRWATRREADR